MASGSVLTFIQSNIYVKRRSERYFIEVSVRNVQVQAICASEIYGASSACHMGLRRVVGLPITKKKFHYQF
jgi:hypothetical protein